MVPLVAPTTQSAEYVFTHFERPDVSLGIPTSAYAIVLSFLVSQYSLYGYDAAAHLTEETKNADKNGPIAILSSIGLITVFGWAFILALTFSIQVTGTTISIHHNAIACFSPAISRSHVLVSLMYHGIDL